MAKRSQQQQNQPELYIELQDKDGKVTIPASTIFDIQLRLNQDTTPEKHSRVVVVRLHPDNTRSSIIAMFRSEDTPYHAQAAKDYYDRLTTIIGAVKLEQWNASPTPPPDPAHPFA